MVATGILADGVAGREAKAGCDAGNEADWDAAVADTGEKNVISAATARTHAQEADGNDQAHLPKE